MSQIHLNLDTPLTDIDIKRKEVLGDEWFHILRDVLNAQPVRQVAKFVGDRRVATEVFPSREDTFRAFKLTQFKSVKLVILGQDPYHNGAADGLAFSTREQETPKSLEAIFQELRKKKLAFPFNNDLTKWAEQGVLLLNTCLTVERGLPSSHKDKGWEVLTSCAIRALSNRKDPVCYFLWGNEAKAFKRHIVNPAHLIIEAEHPAAASYNNREWESNNCFEKCNDFFKLHEVKPIVWDAMNDDLPF